MLDYLNQKIGKNEIIIGGVSETELLLFAEQLYAGLRAGFDISDTLKLCISQSRGRLNSILKNVIEEINGGSYLFEALTNYKKYFPPVFVSLIKIGELSGSLEDSALQLYELLKKETEISQQIRGASIYPAFILVAIFGLGLSVSFFVLPNLIPLFRSLDTELPLSTRILLWFAESFENHGSLILSSFLALVLMLILYTRTEASKPVTHWLKLHLPFIGRLYRKILISRFSRIMYMLLKSGMTLDEALEIAGSAVNNVYYERLIHSVLLLIAKGEGLSESLRSSASLFEPLFLDMLTLGERTGSLEESFLNVAEYYERGVKNATKNLVTSLEPILLIFVGLIVGFVTLAIIGPIYSITGSIR